MPFSAELSAKAQVLSVQYPGRHDRWAEECVDNIPDLADEVFTALLPRLDRPVFLFGHSMGATVAFEVARRLEYHKGFVPGCLFVSGRRAPEHIRDEGVHLRDDDGLLTELRGLSGTEAEVLADRDLIEVLLPAIRSDYKAAETYVYQPGPALSCPIVALVGDSDPRVTVDQACDWREHTSGPFELTVFPGGHFFLSAERPAVSGIVAKRL